MKSRAVALFLSLAVFGVVFGFLGCASAPAPAQEAGRLQKLIDEACFEVVVPRVEKDSLSYEKSLPWELIPYNIRNDKYLPVGTAFAISRSQLITASHVLSLMENSRLYPELCLRGKDGRVYPVADLESFHVKKDFVIFTCKGLQPSRWLRLRPSFAANEPVYAVGNIYGQGIVAVPGSIAGTLPESENGSWNYIKSSPPNGEGSSGGPLLDKDLNAIGVITSKDDNFSYSLPVAEAQASPAGKGVFHTRSTFRFSLLPGKSSESLSFDLELDLPKTLPEVRRIAHAAYVEHCQQGMDRFLGACAGGFFPNGRSSAEALQGSCDSTGIQMLYKDKDDGNWYFSALEKSSSSLPENGRLAYAGVDGTLFLDLLKPDNVSHEQLYDDPKLVMDLILQGVTIPRGFAGQQIRILSLGTPFAEDSYEDAYQRSWGIHFWQLEFSDEVAILFSSPTPGGLVGALRFCSSNDVESWLYDLKKIADLTYIPYAGTLEQWRGCLQQSSRLPLPLSTVRLQYTPGGSLQVQWGDFRLACDDNQLEIADKTRLALMHDFYLDQGKVVWGLRRVSLGEDRRDNYFVSYRYIKPPEGLDDSYAREWYGFVRREHPYNENPYSQDGRTNIGTALSRLGENATFGYSLYLGREGSIDPDTMKQQLSRLKDSLRYGE
jgi:serine protease Do